MTTLVAEYMHDNGMKDDTKIDLPNLTHLRIGILEIWLLPKIRSHQIECFYMSFLPSSDDIPDSENDLGAFLESCDKLKHFTLDNCYTNEIHKIQSQLQTFEVIRGDEHDGMLPSSFLQFLKAHKSSLKNLTLAIKFDNEIANYIYFEMSLDKIVDHNYLECKILELKEATVKNLAIKLHSDFKFYSRLFKCCEMLEVLDVIMPYEKPFEFLGQLSNLPKLKYLKLKRYGITENEFNVLFKFKRLERLIIDCSFNAEYCVKLIRCCPALTHVKMYKTLTKENFDEIFKVCKDLKEIVFIINQVTDEDLESFKYIGSKISLKIEAFMAEFQQVIEKLGDVKNRMTAYSTKLAIRDPFVVVPRILNHMYFSQYEGDFDEFFCCE